MVTSVRLGFDVITNKDAFNGAIVDFWVMSILDEYEASTPDFTQVGVIRSAAVPCFPARDAIERSNGGAFVKMRRCEVELGPEISGSIGIIAHGTRFNH